MGLDPRFTAPGSTLTTIDNPLANAVPANQDQNQTVPTASDTAMQPPVSGGASIFQQLQSSGSKYLGKLGSVASRAMDAGIPPLSALVVGAIHANDPNKDQPTPASQPQRQDVSQSTGVRAVNGIAAGLGDAAAVGTVSPGGGALQGINRTLGARNERLTKENQQQFENEQTITKNKVMVAEANTRMMHEQRLIHNLDQEAMNTSVANGQTQLDNMLHQAAPSKVIAKGLISSEIEPFIKNGKLDPTKETAIPTGIKTVGVDKDGKPINQITFSLVSLPEDVKLDANNSDKETAGKAKDAIDFLNKYAPPASGKWGSDGTQNFTGPEFNLVMQQAHDAQAADLAIKKAQLDAGFQLNEIKKGEEALEFSKDPTMLQAMATASSTGNIMAARNALLQQNANPNSPYFGKYPNLDNDLRQSMGYTQDKDGKKNFVFDKMLEDYQKKLDASQESINDISKKLSTAGSAQEVNQIGADALARLKDPNTPKDQIPQLQRIVDRANAGVTAATNLKADEEREAARIRKEVGEEEPTASPSDLSLVQQIGEGRSRYPNIRTKEGERIGKLVAKAYPDFREDKVDAWFDINKKVTGGDLGKALNSSNTVLEHMRRAYDNTSASAILNPFSEAHNRLATDKPFLTGELGKAVKGGVISMDESHSIQDALFGGITVGNKKQRLKEATQLLMDKIDQYQQQYDDAKPSDRITGKILLRPDAKASYEYVLSDGKVNKTASATQQEQQRNQQVRQQTGAPAGAIDPSKTGLSANKVPVWPMRDGSIQDAQGNKYDPVTGQPLKK